MVAIWTVLVACGDDDGAGKLPDAGGPFDAPLDAPTGAAPVIATVTIDHVLAPNIAVYFQSKDSTKVEMKLTNADGSASAMVEAGGFVTVLEPARPVVAGFIDDSRRLTTFASVQPGDHVYVNIAGNASQQPPEDVEVTVRVPNQELGYTYALHATCASGEIGRGNAPLRRARAAATAAAPVTNTFTFSDCGGKADVLVIGTDNDGVLRSWAYQPDVAITTGTVIEFTEYKDTIERTLSYTTAPGASVAVERLLKGTRRQELYRTSACVSTDNATGEVAFTVPAPPGVTAETVSSPTAGAFDAQHVIEWGADANYALDISAVQLHPFTAAPDLDIANHAITWTEAATGNAPDWLAASYANTRADANGTHDWQWRIVAPYTPGILRYPVLPTTPFDYNARVGDAPAAPAVHAVRGAAGYADAKAYAFTTNDTFALDANRTAPAGRLVLQHSDITSPPNCTPPPAGRAPRAR